MRRFSIALLAPVTVIAAALAVNAPQAAWSADGKDKAAAPRPPDAKRATTRPAGPPGGRSFRRYSKPLTKEQEEEVLAYLKKKRPDLYKQATSQREKDPRRYQRTIRSMWHFISRLKSLPKAVAEAEELRQGLYFRMWRLAKELKDTRDPARQKKLRKQIHELADKRFDADQTIRQHRLSQLEGYIERLKRELKDRADDRKAVVREMVERVIGGAERYREPSERGPRSRPSPPPGHKPPPK